MLKRFFAILMLVSASANILSAATYYVSKSGSDSNAGSQAAPWATVQKAANTAKAGDTVNVASGTYEEAVTISASGTSGSPIVFTGTGTVRQFKLTGSYVTVSGFGVGTSGSGGDGVTLSGSHDTVSGCRINMFSKGVGCATISGSSCVVSNCDMTGSYGAAVVTFGSGSSSSLVVGCTIHDMHDIDAFHLWGSQNVVRGNTVYGIDNPGYSSIPYHADCLQVFGDNGETMQNCVMEGNTFRDSSIQICNVTTDIGNIHDLDIRNNVFCNIASAAFIGVKNTRFMNNVFYKCGTVQTYVIIFYQQTAYDSTGGQVVNNVFLQCGSSPGNAGSGTIGANGANLSALNIKNNYFGGTSYATKSSSSGAYIGTSAINGGDPKFSGAAAYDFHLLSGSPLIGAGINEASLYTTDRDGNGWPTSGAWDVGAFHYGGTVTPPANQPPVVSALTQNATDVDSNMAGFQVLSGTTVQYAGSASDPNSNPLTWQWIYTVNGGSETVFQSGSGTPVAISYTYPAASAGNTYVWTLRVSDGTATAQSQLTIGVEAPPVVAQGLSFEAESGTITAPFVVSGGFISQSSQTTLSGGGRAAYTFSITNAGSYVIQCMVNAPNDAANSFYVNIDAEPTDPANVWQIPLTSGVESRIVNAQGNGTADNPQYVPKVFTLTQGSHQLIIRGREAGTQLDKIAILKLPAAPQNLRILAGP